MRLLAPDVEGGLYTHLLPDGRRDGRILLTPSDAFTTCQILPGPGVLVIVSARDMPFGPPSAVVVESVRVRDWGDVSQHGVLYGLEPLGGIIYEGEGGVAAAAGRAGPVIAVRGGIQWCDWLLRPVADYVHEGRPLSLSVGAGGRAHLVVRREGRTRFLIVPPDGPPVCDLELPWTPSANLAPPVIAETRQILVTGPDRLLSLDPRGAVLWEQERVGSAPATVSSDDAFLVPGRELLAIAPDGRRTPLWESPEPLVTAPVLAGGNLYVASDRRLFVLEAVGP
jgi:hypothetical protein